MLLALRFGAQQNSDDESDEANCKPISATVGVAIMSCHRTSVPMYL